MSNWPPSASRPTGFTGTGSTPFIRSADDRSRSYCLTSPKLASGEIKVEEASKLLAELEQRRGPLYCKVSEKGAVSVYGLQRMPVTLYVEQWERLRLEMSESDYRRRVLLEDIPRERRLYPRFDVAVHLQKRPAAEDDITEFVTAEKLLVALDEAAWLSPVASKGALYER